MNVYQIVTSRILECLKNGVVPWRKPWTVSVPRNVVSGRTYRGINVLLLQSTPFDSPWWLTFNQARKLGGYVKRGEKGMPVVFWKIHEREEPDGSTKKTFVLRYFTAFNLQQTEGIQAPQVEPHRQVEPLAECDGIVASYPDPPVIVHGGNRACYVPALDRIHMPPRSTFVSAEDYYCTIFHELIHSTGSQNRLNRKGISGVIRFGSHSYAFEELVAECGAAFLAARAGISTATLTTSAAYIQSWVERLERNPRWIVDAAAQASRAADLVAGDPDTTSMTPPVDTD